MPRCLLTLISQQDFICNDAVQTLNDNSCDMKCHTLTYKSFPKIKKIKQWGISVHDQLRGEKAIQKYLGAIYHLTNCLHIVLHVSNLSASQMLIAKYKYKILCKSY